MDIQNSTNVAFDKKYDNQRFLGAFDYIVLAIIGSVVFFLFYGVLPLNPSYDKWILNGYVEPDIIQHYAGWLLYRDSAWDFPIGKIADIGNVYLTFTDSIPLLAIFFKLLSPILSETFQYFGIYIFICFVLQSLSGGLLSFELITNRNLESVSKIGVKLFVYFSAIVFTISPIMIERAFRHSALASHWLILFSLYLYFKSKRTNILSFGYIILSILAIGIHPYFLPCVFGIFIFNEIELCIRNKAVVSFKNFLLPFLLTAASGFFIGALGQTSGSMVKNASYGLEGYGYYSMNLNAVLNPTSAGDIVWSKILAPLPQILGNYDGFNYLGIGFILLFIIGVVALALKKELLNIISENKWILILCVFLTVFALSNVLTANSRILFEIPFPDRLLEKLSAFRSSGRMFYPVYYLIICIGLYGASSIKIQNTEKTNKLYVNLIILAAVIILQLFDISPAIKAKRDSFNMEGIEALYSQISEGYESDTWKEIYGKYHEIKPLNIIRDYRLVAFSKKNGLICYAPISNRQFEEDGKLGIYEKHKEELISFSNPECVYITDDGELVNLIINEAPDINVYFTGYYYILCR